MPKPTASFQDSLDAPTRESETTADVSSQSTRVPVLTLLYHPDYARVGETAVLVTLFDGQEVALSRLEPKFSPVRGGVSRPLRDSRLSRKPLLLRPAKNGGITLDTSATSNSVTVDGELVTTSRVLVAEELDRGVVLLVAKSVVLVLRVAEPVLPISVMPELVGEAACVNRVRHDVRGVADVSHPVLVRGETGTGKELVARAIHEKSPRGTRELVTVNMGAIAPELASAELFGAVRGAFTGAHKDRKGYFRQAQGSTLFLDEIGEASAEVQVHLLRALENHEIQPIGSDQALEVDVRIIVATDADLASAVAEGRFRAPLLHRLEKAKITLPPLRERREDIGRLFFHFLRSELEEISETNRLARPAKGQPPFVPADIVMALALHDWPGNVRELHNIVCRIVMASRGSERMIIPPDVRDELTGSSACMFGQPSTRKAYRSPNSVSDQEISDALQASGGILAKAAKLLRMSDTSLKRRIRDSSKFRRAEDICKDEIVGALDKAGGDVAAAARHLGVSPRALKIRMTKLAV